MRSSSAAHLPDKEAEHTDKGIHEADVVADAGHDGLLAVWTNRLHWSRLEHLPLYNSHGGGGGTRRGEDRGCVTWSKVTGPRTIVLVYRMRKVSRRSIVTTCSTWINFYKPLLTIDLVDNVAWILSIMRKSRWNLVLVNMKCFLKGIVHPKMTILSLITHPHVVPNP